ncbi:FUSC family membrane protein [Ottowia sp.]|uniref:FUSC family protein n=2 Tax=Ottowia sp. TaxID=1898956 RepID=UPI002CEAF64E|nr:FUSC family membrane protein [Ottowia sp.]HPZ57511.1 FUSC family membrane protein [Ottowia sp.]HQD49275.1 FUSC family membrane protein [Ottowia sp.]
MSADPLTRWLGAARRQRVLRVALSDYVLNGASAAFGMFMVSALMHALFGAEAAANATVGVIAALAPDVVGPRRGKLAHLAVAPLIGVPLFLAVQLLRGHPVGLGLFLVPATFLVFLGMAWGKRGAPVAIGVMLVMVFAMSTPVPTGAAQALTRTFYCGLGCALYVLYAVAAHSLLNARYRTQVTADLLLAVAALLRAHARRVAAAPSPHDDDPAAGLGDLLKRQAALADQLQATRDVVLEAPRTPRRQQLAGMLMVVLEMRDHLVASELDLDRVRQAADHAQALGEIAAIYRDMATDVERLADALLLHQRPQPAADHQARLSALRRASDDEAAASGHAVDEAAALLRGVAYRARHQNDAVRQLAALARGEAAPDLAVVRASWRLFVSPTDWSLQPFFTVWHWRQPALRHAVRAALAVGTGYGIATLLPWGSHDYWVLLTIVVVLRGSLAQTLERRNQRVAGTVIGSLLATGLLALHPATLVMVLAATVAQGVAHAFALRRYTVTAIAASVLGLVQSHMLYAGDSPAFALLERVGDTVLGAGIAWAFAYVLPSWERGQIAGLVRRVLRALDRHAAQSLGLARIDEIDTEPELTWRLARREAYDALSALVQATARALAEPRAVQPPLALLEQLQGHSYQLLGQLSAVKSMLLLRRNQLRLDDLAPPLAQSAARIHDTLTAPASTAAPSPAADDARTTEPGLPAVPEDLPDPFEQDISPWVLRRLALAENLAVRVRRNADQINAQLAAPTAPTDATDATAT